MRNETTIPRPAALLGKNERAVWNSEYPAHVAIVLGAFDQGRRCPRRRAVVDVLLSLIDPRVERLARDPRDERGGLTSWWAVGELYRDARGAIDRALANVDEAGAILADVLDLEKRARANPPALLDRVDSDSAGRAFDILGTLVNVARLIVAEKGDLSAVNGFARSYCNAIRASDRNSPELKSVADMIRARVPEPDLDDLEPNPRR